MQELLQLFLVDQADEQLVIDRPIDFFAVAADAAPLPAARRRRHGRGAGPSRHPA